MPALGRKIQFQPVNVVGIGVDIEPVASFKGRPTGDRLYSRLFSEAEIAYCRRHADCSARFAARFCAKEAFVKAARAAAPLRVTDVEVFNDEDGAPSLLPRSSRPEVRKFFAAHEVSVSLSHTKDMAAAFVLVVARKAKGRRRRGR